MSDENVKQRNGKKQKKEFQCPPTESQRKMIRDALKEADNALFIIEGARSTINEIAKNLLEELGMPKSLFNQCLRTFHKDNFSEIQETTEVFEETYQQITKV